MTSWILRTLAFTVLIGILPVSLAAQGFSSGSDGSDGALSLTTPGTVVFDPVALGLDPDGDHIFHFTTITIGAGVSVELSAATLSRAVIWLASGDVVIDGVLDLNGESGQASTDLFNPGTRQVAIPGAGGFGGGIASFAGGNVAQPGLGPGGGLVSTGTIEHGSYATGNRAYGNNFLVPLIGGSGGAGDQSGGGAGGGALFIASSSSITVTNPGGIQADGGASGSANTTGVRGGGGSGGSIRLAAPVLTGSGHLLARGGSGNGSASAGRIRLEAFDYSMNGSMNPSPSRTAPAALFLPTSAPPTLRVTTVDGVAVAGDPSGIFSMPDVTISNAAPVTVAIEASGVPLGTAPEILVWSENGNDQTVTATALAGTVALSTASATVTLPSGFSRSMVRANWTP